MIAGRPAPTIHKPTLYTRKVNANNNGNIQNVYGNNIAAWKSLGASYQRLNAGETAARRRREKETKTAIRELGRMVTVFN
jgi:hypothetical protein